ncbi:hypothetical protein [Candidatus Magnetominusculus xianensis]|uniref:hypothetical protein n=1 Tax=Candidatus Magnetominusculus xianensis TaxID=1748249 RepID=UPI0019F24D6A|nr:hypothetical protein [Candidatus Magnetominusculus xianensis]MBF0403455.1 hypothetical protein [Nitrospirota bacterium]
MRLVLLLVVSSALLSPVAGFAEKCYYKLYSVSFKKSYLKKKYKVRAFFLDDARDVVRIPKIPRGWSYVFYEQLSHGLIATASSDRNAVGIDYFKDFLIIVFAPETPNEKLRLNMKLVYNKSNGTSEINILETKDFDFKDIHKCQ